MTTINKLMAGPFGSFIKVFVVAVCTLIMQNGSIYGLDRNHVLDAGMMSCIPMILNLMNPEYKQY